MTIERVLVAIDGSDHAAAALDLAAEIARRFAAELIAVHVVTDRPLSDAERKLAAVEFHTEIARSFDSTAAVGARDDLRLMSDRVAAQALESGRRFRFALGERLLADAAARARTQTGLEVRILLREGDPASALLAAAKETGADLIVMGRRGLGELAGLLLGSVSHKVTHLAECACLTVR